MRLKDLQQPRPGMKRAGKIRLGYMLRKCTHCEKPTRAKIETCDKCGKRNPKPEPRNMYPTSTSFFVLDDVPELVEIYGNQPNRLNIWFPFDSIDEVLPAAYKLHSASSILCTGDGDRIQYAINAQTGKPVIRDGIALVDFSETSADNKPVEFGQGEVVPCPGYQKDLYKKCAYCRIEAPLRFMIREMPRFVFYEIGTGSINNYMNLVQQLSYFAAPKSEGGMGVGLKGIPFVLSLVKSTISVPNLDRKGNLKPSEPPRKRVEKYLLSLEVDPKYMLDLAEAQRRLATPSRILLGAGIDYSNELVVDDDALDGESMPVAYVPPEIVEVEVEPEATPESVKDEFDLTKVEFVNKVKDELGIVPAVTGYILKLAGLMNGQGYEKAKAREYWEALRTTGVGCQRFVGRVLKEIPYYLNASHIFETMTTLEISYSADSGDSAFVKLDTYARKAADGEMSV